MDVATERKMVRAIVRQVHPDLFTAYPYERSKNSEALKALNVYADQLSQGMRPQPAQLTFYVRQEGSEDDVLGQVSAELPSYGSLGPLFFAFGLISEEELRQGAGSVDGRTADDRDLAAWLRETVDEAVRTADQHDSLKRMIRELRVSVQDRFRLAAVQVGGEFAVSTEEQQRQIEALKVLEANMEQLTAGDPDMFEGLTIRLYHPDSRPLGTLSYVDWNGTYNQRTAPIASHVADNGVVHVVADGEVMRDLLPNLDLSRARLLSRLGSFWLQRSRDLSSVLQELLGVQAVWCDTRSEDSSQQFVLWAGAVLDERQRFEASLQRRQFAFSLLAHSDHSSPMLDFLASSSVLQVRCDCPPSHLLDFLCSSAGLSANETAAQVAGSREEEEQLLAEVRDALGAKHVIRVCSSYNQDKVLGAARRLLECAPAIRLAGVDLSGASLAIDDCYELWDSGFISIPHDFNLSDLQPKLKALLSSGNAATTSAASAAAGYSGDASGSYGSGGANGGGYGYPEGTSQESPAPGELAGQYGAGPVRAGAAAGASRGGTAAAGGGVVWGQRLQQQRHVGRFQQRRRAAAGLRVRQHGASLRML
ncbi:hypothetical protein ACK3TF_001655 [Chlorella vulgaris]